jgi:hypothetical protein
VRWFGAQDSQAEAAPKMMDKIAIGAVALLGVLLGIFPQLANAWVAPAMAGFANLTP